MFADRRMAAAVIAGIVAFALVAYLAREVFAVGSLATAIGLLAGYAVAHAAHRLGGSRP